MSRGSEIAIGGVCALLSLVFGMLAFIRANEGQASQSVMLMLLVATVSGLLSFALLVKWGRPMTTRVAVGIVSLLGLLAMIGAAMSGQLKANGILWIVFGAGGLFYAVTGKFPDSFPMSEVFGSPSAPPRKPKSTVATSTKKKSKKRPSIYEE